MDDLVGSTHWWDPATFGVYLRLLIHQAAHEGLPDNSTTLRAIAGASGLHDDRWTEIETIVREKFIVQEDGRLANPRLTAEMQQRNKTRDGKIAAASKSAEVRAAKAGVEQNSAPAKAAVEQNSAPAKAAVEQKSAPAKASTSTSTSTSSSVVVEDTQLNMQTAIVAQQHADDDGDDDGVGKQLLKLMGLESRPISAKERGKIAKKRDLLTPDALQRLASWYPKGRKRRRREPDALLFLIEDLETCLDQCSRSSAKFAKPKVKVKVPSEFRDWLQTADLPVRFSYLDASTAWSVLEIQQLFEHRAA